MADYCNAHHCPQPCTICAEDEDWKRAIQSIERGLRSLGDLYRKSTKRRNTALRQVGVLAVELAEIKQHRPSEAEDKSPEV